MNKGKDICNALKEIRRQIADNNGIKLEISECTFQGECRGTCPKCEAELRYLDTQLQKRHRAGHVIKVAGIAAGTLAILSPLMLSGTSPNMHYMEMDNLVKRKEHDTKVIKGVVYEEYPDSSGIFEPILGASVTNLRTRNQVESDIDGNFQISGNIGDSIRISYLGFATKDIVITDNSNLRIILKLDVDVLSTAIVMGGAIVVNRFPAARIEIRPEKNELMIKVLTKSGIEVNPKLWGLKFEALRIGPNGDVDGDNYDVGDKKYLEFGIDTQNNIIISIDEITQYLGDRYRKYNSPTNKIILRGYIEGYSKDYVDSQEIELPRH